MCPPQNESDPLLTLPGKTASTVRKNKRKRQKRNFMLLAIALGVLAMVSVTMVVVNKASKDGSAASAAPSSILGRARAARSRVSFDEMTGQYTVNWETAASTATATATATNVGVSSSSSVITPSTTFSELAEIMLLPWYEASIIAVLDDPVWDVKKKGIDPDSIYAIRKVLLITRSMLDVFSPVFPDTSYSKKKKKIRNGGKSTNSNSEDDHSLWKKLRTLYRRGYQAAGELHDLKDLTYSKKLYKTRLDAVLSWKQDFVNFQKTHRIRRYLYSNFDRGFGGIDPNGCYYHKASHLFWADSSLLNLPCGDDSGTTSLRSLASVQLEHSLGYLEIIKNYTTVMPREHEVDFHNLRKELRIFVDECDLFGNVLVPDENETAVVVVVSGDDVDVDDHADDDESSTVTTTTSLEDTVELLRSAQEFLGAINDKWTAHDIYIQDDSHPKTRTKLAKETDEMWHSFLHWESKKDLKGTMERLLQRLNE